MTRSASDVLTHEFLQVRAKILEVAAFFDRLDEAPVDRGAADMNARQLELLRLGCQILTGDEGSKAARVQILFSREYEASWREKFNV